MSSRTVFVVVGAALVAVLAWMFLRSPDEAPAASDPGAVPSAADSGAAGSPVAARRGDASDTPAERHVVTGRVVADAGPVAGAWVMLRRHEASDEGARQTTVRTGPDGAFEFDDVASGRWAVSATAPGFLPGVHRRLDLEGSDPEPIELRLASGGHRVHGSIDDVMGGPVEAALVHVVPLSGFAALREHEGFATMSDEDGTYELRVLPGRYRLEVEHPDYAADGRGIEITSGDSQQDFQLVPTASIEGVVVAGEGGPVVANARVQWMRERTLVLAEGRRQTVRAGGGTVTTDASGAFRITGLPPGMVQLSARAPHKATSEDLGVPVAIAEHVQGIQLVVGDAFDVRGRVIDGGTGDPIAGVSVQLLGGPDQQIATESAADGSFLLPGIVAGHYTLMGIAEGYALQMPGTALEVAADVDDVVLELDAGLKIRGRVDPPQLAQVRVEMKPEQMRMGAALFVAASAGGVETEADGTFEIGPVQPGEITVVATSASGESGETAVTVGPEGADDVVVTLERRATVRGHLRGLDGSPVAQAQVSLRKPAADGSVMRLTINGRDMGTQAGVTADDGSFEIAGLAAATYELSIVDRYGDALELRGGATVGPSGEPELEVGTADRSGVALTVDAHDGVVAGTVLADDGSAAADVWVTLARLPDPVAPEPEPEPEPSEGPRSRSESHVEIATSGGSLGRAERPPALTGEDGSFRFAGLRDGTYQVTAEADGGQSRVSDQARVGQRVTLRLLPLAGVEGNVTLDGEVVASFQVSVEGPTSRRRRVRDARGHFAVDRLDPGPYTLRVQAGGATGTASFEAEAGRTVTRDIVMERPAKVRGSLVGDDGAPVEHAMILVGEGSQEEGKVEIRREGDEEAIMTDAEGKFDFTCGAGSRVLVAIEPGQPEPIAVKFFVAHSGDDIDLGQLSPDDKPPGAGGGKVENHDEEVVEGG